MESIKKVLITGGSTGLGFELAKLYAADGHDLLLISQNKERLNSSSELIRKKTGVEVDILAIDLSLLNSTEQVYEYCKGKNWQIDVLINNAGFAYWGKFLDQEITNISSMIQLHMTTPTLLSRLFGKDMKKRGYGNIIQIVSTSAYQSGPYMATYFASKAYLLQLSEAVQIEENGAPFIQIVCPGAFISDFKERASMQDVIFFSRKGVSSAESIARKVYKSIKSKRSIIIPGFHNRLIIFFLRLFPRNFVHRVVGWFLKK